MSKTMLRGALALCLAIVAASTALGADEEGAGGGGSMSDSPYKNGPPPITGGFTDTSQGGTKGSGDPLAVPPGVKPPSQAAKPGDAPKPAAANTPPASH